MYNRRFAIDASAIGLSSLCIFHCLALPVLAVSMPVAGVLSEAEWIHRVLVLMTLPITLFAIARDRASGLSLAFVLPALTGLALLLASAFVEAFHDHEVLLTTLGALFLASAHAWRWIKKHAR